MKAVAVLLLFLCAVEMQARVIVDDYGRSIHVKDKITKIYAASPPITMSVLAFDPNLVAALNMPLNKEESRYVKTAAEKPVVGGFFGQGQTPNFEVLATVKPDVVIVWGGMPGIDKIVKKFSVLKLPVILVKNSTIYDLVGQFRLYGELSGEKERAKKLIAYTKETLSLIDSLQGELSKRAPVRYYFAEGSDGMSSECQGSFHIEPFKYAGAKNALDCKMSSNYGMEKISFEKILLSKPDVIVAMENSFMQQVYKDPRWKGLKAVKEKKVYLVPSTPFNYITRPPSFMRLMGIRWLIHTFYPSLLPGSLKEEKQRFDKLFFGSLK